MDEEPMSFEAKRRAGAYEVGEFSLYDKEMYQLYCKDYSETPKSPKAVGKIFKEIGFLSEKRSDTTWYCIGTKTSEIEKGPKRIAEPISCNTITRAVNRAPRATLSVCFFVFDILNYLRYCPRCFAQVISKSEK